MPNNKSYYYWLLGHENVKLVIIPTSIKACGHRVGFNPINHVSVCLRLILPSWFCCRFGRKRPLLFCCFLVAVLSLLSGVIPKQGGTLSLLRVSPLVSHVPWMYQSWVSDLTTVTKKPKITITISNRLLEWHVLANWYFGFQLMRTKATAL